MSAPSDDRFLRACRGEPVDRPPLWLMRQAGRYLPEYRALRERIEFSALCRTPELAVEATLQPIERFGFDAAILFSDIMVAAEPLGFTVRFEPGPVIDDPVRTLDDVARLGAADPRDSVPFVYETIRLLRRELGGRVPLIGFAAAPFTLAAYLVEGRGSRDFERTRALVLGDPAAARLLLDKVALTTAEYVAAQVEAGAQAIQLFDTWAGLLGLAEYRELSLPFVQRVFDRLRDTGVPRIYFALDAAHLLPAIRDCGATVIGLDWRLPLSAASSQLGHRFAVQGNLDPCALLAGPEVVERHARRVLAEGAGLPGHVFNLGHGILPGTPLESVEALVRTVHRAAHPGPAVR